MLLEDLNWMDVESYLKQDDRIILVSGTCEQHCYLSLLTDVKIPMAIATIAAEREGVLVAPSINYGVSPTFAAFPGTIAIRVETFQRVVQDVISSLFAQGFKRIFVLNGHGGNKLTEVLVELTNTHRDLKLDWLDWWQHPIVEEIAKQHGLEKGHANWMENFSFTRVTDDMPQGIKARVQLPVVADAATTRQLLGDGSYGGAYQAEDAVMEQLLEAVAGVVQEKLRTM